MCMVAFSFFKPSHPPSFLSMYNQTENINLWDIILLQKFWKSLPIIDEVKCNSSVIHFIPNISLHSSVDHLEQGSASAGELFFRVQPHWQLDSIRKQIPPIILQPAHIQPFQLGGGLNQPCLLFRLHPAAGGEIWRQPEARNSLLLLLGNSLAADSCLEGWSKQVGKRCHRLPGTQCWLAKVDKPLKIKHWCEQRLCKTKLSAAA